MTDLTPERLAEIRECIAGMIETGMLTPRARLALVELLAGYTATQSRIADLERRLRDAEKRRDELDCCCCGSRMDAHNIGSGHSPVSMYDYARSQLEERIEEAERRLREATEPRPIATVPNSDDYLVFQPETKVGRDTLPAVTGGDQ